MRLIGRQRSDADRRLVRTRITQKGLDVLEALDTRIRKAHRDRLAHVSHARLRGLVDALAEVRRQVW